MTCTSAVVVVAVVVVDAFVWIIVAGAGAGLLAAGRVIAGCDGGGVWQGTDGAASIYRDATKPRANLSRGPRKDAVSGYVGRCNARLWKEVAGGIVVPACCRGCDSSVGRRHDTQFPYQRGKSTGFAKPTMIPTCSCCLRARQSNCSVYFIYLRALI